ncbi:MAG: transaldolase, partial [Chloroflexi bacterium]|nr:transaldolase [Chloroflexota bacterium]
MNSLQALRDQGQSFWIDSIDRRLVTGGELRRLIVADGLRGLTSNPSIFQSAIAGSSQYD